METYHEKFWVLVKAGLHLSQLRAEQNNNHENERSRTMLYNATILSPCFSQYDVNPLPLICPHSHNVCVVCPCKCLQQPTSQVPLHSWGPLTLLSILPQESEHKHITLKPRNHTNRLQSSLHRYVSPLIRLVTRFLLNAPRTTPHSLFGNTETQALVWENYCPLKATCWRSPTCQSHL